jgi:DNA-binding NtrC family response regulator
MTVRKEKDSTNSKPTPAHSLKNVVNSCQEELISNYLKANLNDASFDFIEFMREFEKQIIESALNLTQFNQKMAAFILGLKPTTLNEKIKKHKIDTRNLELKDFIRLNSSLTSEE